MSCNLYSGYRISQIWLLDNLNKNYNENLNIAS